MITLNLLPPKKKREFVLLEQDIVIKNAISILLLLTILAAITLLAGKFLLQNHFNQTVEQSTLTTRTAKIFNSEIKLFNELLENTDNVQQKYLPWTKFLTALSGLVPTRIVLNSIAVTQDSAETYQIFLTGLAPTREDLLELQNNLDNSSFLTAVNVPLDNLLKKESIEFTITASILTDNLLVP